MYPKLLTINGFSIDSFGVMVALAFLAAYFLTARELKRKGAPAKTADDMLLWVLVCSIAGAKIFFLVENFTMRQIYSNFPEVVFSGHGLTFYGGFLGGMAAGIYRAKKNGTGVFRTLDAAAPALALAYAIGRVGCLLVGDDYGTASSLPWAMAFPNGSPPVDFPVHPTQIYETVSMTAVFAVLWKLRTAARADGWLFALYLILSGTERFLVEFLRTTTPSPVPELSVAQIIALALVVFGAAKMRAVRNA